MPLFTAFPISVKLHNAFPFTPRAPQAMRPPNTLKMFDAPLFGIELFKDFKNGLLPAHGVPSYV
jgi:hypothetical protein